MGRDEDGEGMAEMFGKMLGMTGANIAGVFPSLEQFMDIQIDMAPIKDLRVGDRLKWRFPDRINVRGLKPDTVVFVASVFPERAEVPKGNRIRRFDFSYYSMEGEDMEPIEWIGESRQWERC